MKKDYNFNQSIKMALHSGSISLRIFKNQKFKKNRKILMKRVQKEDNLYGDTIISRHNI